MDCLYCQGELVQKKVSYTATRRGYHLIIDDVPAWVCEQCGEVLFDEEVVMAVTQGSTLDEAVQNPREAIQPHLEGEDLSEIELGGSINDETRF